MKTPQQSRRAFLAQTGTAAGAGWLAYAFPALLSVAELACTAQTAQAEFVTFTPEEAADFEALTAQIIPSGETPGAREAGVVYFADLALAPEAPLHPMHTPLRAGLADLKAMAQDKGSTASFAALPDAAQKEVVSALEATPLFGMARTLTLFGVFAHPKYGGNRDKVGWAMIGYEDRHAWQPPFGHYDANYVEEEG